MQVCEECGSVNIFFDAYVNVNDPDDIRTFDATYCGDCATFCSIINAEDFFAMQPERATMI